MNTTRASCGHPTAAVGVFIVEWKSIHTGNEIHRREYPTEHLAREWADNVRDNAIRNGAPQIADTVTVRSAR